MLLILLHLQLGVCALAAGALCIAIMAPLQLFLGRRMSADAEAAAVRSILLFMVKYIMGNFLWVIMVL